MVVQAAGVGRHGRHLRRRVRTGGDDAQRQLHAQRPTLGQLVQPSACIGVDTVTDALVHQRDRLLEAESQHRRADHDAMSIVHEIVEPEVAVGACRHHGTQVGGALRCARPVHRATRAQGDRPRPPSTPRPAPSAQPRPARW